MTPGIGTDCRWEGAKKREGNGREMEEKFGMDGNSPLIPEPAIPPMIPKDGSQQMRSTRLPDVSGALVETAGVPNVNSSWGKEIVRIATPKLT